MVLTRSSAAAASFEQQEPNPQPASTTAGAGTLTAVASTQTSRIPSTVSLSIRIDLDRAEIERFCPVEDLNFFLRPGARGHLIAQIRVDTATGTGLQLHCGHDGEASIVVKHAEQHSKIDASIISRATASVLPVQYVLELALLPFGVRLEAPEADYRHRCDMDGHLPPSGNDSAAVSSCAMHFPAGISANVDRSITHYEP